MPGVAAAGGSRPRAEGSAALLSGTGEDPEQVVAFLMKKFSGLIDRVQVAEGRQARAQEQATALELQMREVAEQRRATTKKLQAQLQVGRAGVERFQRQLQEVRLGAVDTADGLRRARRAATQLHQQCEALDARCQADRRSLFDTADAVAQSDEAWAACEVERARLRADAGGMGSQLAAVEEELVTVRELERHRRADTRVLEERVGEACRAWQAAERRAEAQHEEVCGALKTVTLYRERLDSARHALQRREEELHEEDTELSKLQAEAQRREQEQQQVQRGLARLQEVRASLERALRENVEAREQYRAAQRRRQSFLEEGAVSAAAHGEAQAKLASADERLTAASAELNRWRQRLQALREAVEKCKSKRQLLEDDRQDIGCAEHLQAELQRVFAETERLRSEHEEAAATADDLQRRLRLAEPAVETARRRARELEQGLEDADAEALRARHRKDTLLREVGQNREKMRGLRRRHGQLSERSQALEKRLLRSSGAFGGTAGFAAAAAAAVSAAPYCGPLEGTRGAARTPRSMASSQAPTALAAPRLGPELQAAPAALWGTEPSLTAGHGAEGLGYLRQWIELEEARLGVARTPPKPCSAPSSPKARSPPPRSAKALAALKAGAGPAEAVALLDEHKDAGAEAAGPARPPDA